MYRLVVQLLEPYTFLMVTLLLTTAVAWKKQRPRSRPLTASLVLLVLLWVLSTPLAGYFALGFIESGYPPGKTIPAPTDTIVVLAADMVLDDETGLEARLGNSTLQRCLHAAKLYRKAGGCRLILSGGKVDLSRPGPPLAEAMRDFLVELGLDPAQLVLEDKSTTTFENARFSKPLVEEQSGHRVFLVTEAMHMFRAERCFRKQGIEVIPAPCDHHAREHFVTILSVLPTSGGISGVGTATHEAIGLIWYRLRGRI